MVSLQYDNWREHLKYIDRCTGVSEVTGKSLIMWFEPLLSSITSEGSIPYLLNTKERYRASPLASAIVWLSSANLIPLDILDLMQNRLLFMRDENEESDPQTPNPKKYIGDEEGWSLGEGVSVWSTSMALIALLDSFENGVKKASSFKSSVLWLANQRDPSTLGWAYQLSENCESNVVIHKRRK